MSYQFQDLVLGAAIRYHDEHWKTFRPLWNPEVFVELERIKIAKAILEISEAGQDVSIQLINEVMKHSSSELVKRIYLDAPIALNVEWMLRQLNDWYNIKSHVLDMSAALQIVVNAKPMDKTDDVLSDIKNIAQKMYEARTDKLDCFRMKEILESTIEQILDRAEGKDTTWKNAVKSNLEKIDSSIQGFRGGRLYIIAARPSVGKTSFATYLCLEAIKQGKKPVFFSNEMSKEEIMHKILSSFAGVPGTALQVGSLTDTQNALITSTTNRLANYNLIIDEKSGWSLDQLISTVYRLHSRNECDIVYVDYIQQVRVTKANTKQEQVSIVSDALKKLSRDLNIPVIALAQINRDAEKTGGKDVCPSLIHIKDSGSIEQDADVVMILHRPENGPQETITELELRLAKNRHGNVGRCNLKFNHNLCRYFH